MAYYDALIAKWPSVQGADTASKLAALNAETVAVATKQDVRVSTVQGKLMLAEAWLKLKAYAAANPTTQTGQVAQMLLDMCSSPSLNTFQMSDPATYSSVQGMLAALTTDAATGVTAALEAQLMALADMPPVSWWQANNYPRQFDLGDIAAAGLN